MGAGGMIGVAHPLATMAVVATLLIGAGLAPGASPGGGAYGARSVTHGGGSDAVGNFTAAIHRLVELVGLAGSGILALVWARVAFSWFSNDVAKKIQAKDRARDALVGSLLFVAAVTGLAWGLTHWVVTGS